LRTEAAGDNQRGLADCTGFFGVIDEEGFPLAYKSQRFINNHLSLQAVSDDLFRNKERSNF